MTTLPDTEITTKTKVSIWCSLKTRVPLAFLIPLVTCVGMLGTIAIKSGFEAAEKFKEQNMKALNSQVKEKLENYLEEPHLINRINTDAISERQLNLKNVDVLEKYFWKQAKLFPYVNGIQFGTDKNGLVRSIVREGDKLSFNIGYASPERKNVVMDATDKGERGKITKVSRDYDPRKRPWYKTALGKNKSIWTPVFAKRTSSKTQLRLSAVQEVYDNKTNEFLGVLAVDFFLTQISDFLNNFAENTSKKIFIVERSGKLIAASSDKPLFIDKGKNTTIQRVSASDSEDLIIKGATQKINTEFSGFGNISNDEFFTFSALGETQIAKITPFNEFNLDWLIILVIPEIEFMQAVEQTRNTTIILGIGTFAFSILLGLLVTRWLINPILKLNEAAKQIEDDSIPFEPEKIAPITQRSDELGELAGMFNDMAHEIFAREQSLKDRVQQMRQETDQAKKAALASGLSGNVDINTLLLRSQQARQKVGD